MIYLLIIIPGNSSIFPIGNRENIFTFVISFIICKLSLPLSHRMAQQVWSLILNIMLSQLQQLPQPLVLFMQRTWQRLQDHWLAQGYFLIQMDRLLLQIPARKVAFPLNGLQLQRSVITLFQTCDLVFFSLGPLKNWATWAWLFTRLCKLMLLSSMSLAQTFLKVALAWGQVTVASLNAFLFVRQIYKVVAGRFILVFSLEELYNLYRSRA